MAKKLLRHPTATIARGIATAVFPELEKQIETVLLVGGAFLYCCKISHCKTSEYDGALTSDSRY